MSFHVPERARSTTHPILGSTSEDGNNGLFLMPSPEPGWTLALICSDGEGWEHVSVHAYRASNEQRKRIPTWTEMAWVKRLCWDAEDVTIQFYPREPEYVNCHPCVLHWWRPIGQEIPTPPPKLVGPK